MYYHKLIMDIVPNEFSIMRTDMDMAPNKFNIMRTDMTIVTN